MDLSNGFRIANLAVGLLMILGGVGLFFPNIGFTNVIRGCFLILFGLATAGLEFQTPPYAARYASFMFSFVGRGFFYLFIGMITLGDSWYNKIPGAIVAITGLAYIVLEFLPSIEPPANMREADQGWGAEQV